MTHEQDEGLSEIAEVTKLSRASLVSLAVDALIARVRKSGNIPAPLARKIKPPRQPRTPSHGS